jgi:hypothetical protein
MDDMDAKIGDAVKHAPEWCGAICCRATSYHEKARLIRPGSIGFIKRPLTTNCGRLTRRRREWQLSTQ